LAPAREGFVVLKVTRCWLRKGRCVAGGISHRRWAMVPRFLPMIFPRLAGALAALTIVAATVRAADFQPAIVYDMGGKFDRSFNQSASEGVERFKKDTGIAAREFEITNARAARAGVHADGPPRLRDH